MSRWRLLVLALVGALVGVVLLAVPAQADVVTVSGFVRTSGGAPINGLTVTAWAPYGALSALSTSTTSSDGSYQLQVERGTSIQLLLRGDYAGEPQFLSSQTEVFTLTGSRTEDLVVTSVVPVHVHVYEYDGQPSVGASVTPQPPQSVTRTSGGLNLTSWITGFTCQTDVSGTCDVRALQNGSIGGFAIAGRGRDAEQFPATTVPFEVSKFYSLARAHPVTGRVATSDGTPVAGATVSLGSGRDATTSADGSFEVWSAPGSLSLRVKGMLGQGGWTVPFEVQSGTFTLDSSRSVAVSLPEVGTLNVRVRDAVGSPVPDARVGLAYPGSTKSWTTGSIPMTGYLLRQGGAQLDCRDTDAGGTCGFATFLGGSHGQVDVMTPTGLAANAQLQAGAENEVIARLPRYVTAFSAGSVTGRLSGELSTGAELVDFAVSAFDTPDGYQPLVGRIDYRARVAQPGGMSRLDLHLPSGAVPNALLRVDASGQLAAVPAAEYSGDLSSISVADGSPADLDGVADGVVTTNLIPVRKDPIVFLTDELAGAAKGKAYRMQLAADGPGAPFSWSLAGGALPPGLVLSTDGVISGVPTSLGDSGFTVRVSDRFGYSATQTYVLHVSTIAVTTLTVPDGFIGGTYSVPLQFTGGPFPVWRLVSGYLPPGLKLANGSISGTPTTAGTYTFWVTVTSNGATSNPPQRLTMVVHPMEIATTALPNAPVWSSYSQKLTTHGGKSTLVWAITGGALPPGLALSTAGTISGKPTTVGTYSVTVRVTDSSSPKQTATKTLTLVVTPMAVATSTLPGAKKGQYYSATLVASGGKPTLTWSLAGGSLPPGMQVVSGGRVTGYPQAVGTWTFTVQVTDASSPKNVATRTLTLTVT